MAPQFTNQSNGELFAYNIKVLFAIGQVHEPALEARLIEEQSRTGDLLRTPSYDGYHNLSLKVFEAYELTLQQYRFRWIIRCDDIMSRVLEQLVDLRESH